MLVFMLLRWLEEGATDFGGGQARGAGDWRTRGAKGENLWGGEGRFRLLLAQPPIGWEWSLSVMHLPMKPRRAGLVHASIVKIGTQPSEIVPHLKCFDGRTLECAGTCKLPQHAWTCALLTGQGILTNAR
eukprot:scaffold703_cov245-Pinguiococcus_pyrenoidosus.AAC.1